MPAFSRLILALFSLLPAATDSLPEPLGQHVDDFELVDGRGDVHRLSDWSESRLVVLVFLGTECPLAKLYAQRLNELDEEFKGHGVRLIGVNANQQDSADDIDAFVRDSGVRFPVLRDVGNVLADRLAAQRTPEVFVLDHQRAVRYRGRIDDQYGIGVQRTKPSQRYLALAIEHLLADRDVEIPQAEAVGCFIGRLKETELNGDEASQPAITFNRDIAPIFYRHCTSCHRAGSIGPFSLMTYDDAAAWSATIQEVIAQRRMPPWLADPKHGQFLNERRLSENEKKLINDWIAQGMPEGDSRDLSAAPTFADSWRIGKPDLVVPMPVEFNLPASGIVDYQYFEVDPGFTEDKWIQAAELLPENRRVLHHGLIFLRPPGSKDLVAQGDLNSVYLTGSAAGSPPLSLPTGMAKRIPAGWRLVFQMHYTTTGRPERDRSRLGLVFADPRMVQKEDATNMALNMNLTLQPHAEDTVVEASNKLPHNVLLLSLSPHMHFRGKSFRYEARYPDGGSEILLDIPRYDFGWQDTYYLKEPKRLPRGTVLHCTAHFDNSAKNAVNPDPDATVKWGEQSSDEMMIGYYDIVFADQDLTQSAAWPLRAWKAGLLAFRWILPASAIVGLWLVLRQYRPGSQLVRHPATPI